MSCPALVKVTRHGEWIQSGGALRMGYGSRTWTIMQEGNSTVQWLLIAVTSGTVELPVVVDAASEWLLGACGSLWNRWCDRVPEEHPEWPSWFHQESQRASCP